MALAGTPEQRLLRADPDSLGADLYRLRLQPLSQPQDGAGSLGYRTDFPPVAPAPAAGGRRTAARRRPVVDALRVTGHGRRTTGTEHPATAQATTDQPGLP